MRRAVSQAVFVAMIAMVAACGTARVIQRTQSGGGAGGTIELEGDRNKAMEQANEEMAAHCGPNHFTIVQDGEEEIDAAASTDTATQDAPTTPALRDGRRSATSALSSPPQSARTTTVWRVHYQCGTGSAPVGGAPGDPPSPAEEPVPSPSPR